MLKLPTTRELFQTFNLYKEIFFLEFGKQRKRVKFKITVEVMLIILRVSGNFDHSQNSVECKTCHFA